MLDDGSAPTASVVTLMVEWLHGRPKRDEHLKCKDCGHSNHWVSTVCRKFSDEGRGPPRRSPRRSGEGHGYGGVGKSGQSPKGNQPHRDRSTPGDVPGDRAGDAGAARGEQQPSSCTAARHPCVPQKQVSHPSEAC